MSEVLRHCCKFNSLFILSVTVIIVYFAESINEWAAKNYRLFARQQYFDSTGLFISVVFSTPILFNCLVIVVMWLISTGNLFVEVKKMKIKRTQKQRDKEQKKDKSNKEKEEKENNDSKEDGKNVEQKKDRKNNEDIESKKDK
ncbi:hypothetical protein KUTeg_014805 [Tegillarca granosa]|uniref:Transmembrane protein 18 n=1 Tax=Tegillarca granosa TaxID=220873 RepID=A0ABQ9ER53_TEGGR|nr:hypothetical protein KUTeg_021031 [Tegillarca granosa]KAJ8307640.1 hypothetical protein KUTeg_014805 [Tegillarca granosa]